MAEARCSLFVLFLNYLRNEEKLWRERAGLPHARLEEPDLSQTLQMPQQPIPIVPLEDSQSPFDLNAVLPAGIAKGCKQPLFGLLFQVTHSFLRTQRS